LSGFFTTCEDNRLKHTQAQTVIATAILRQLHAVVVTRTAWDPKVARNGLSGIRFDTAAA
jgi:transposase